MKIPLESCRLVALAFAGERKLTDLGTLCPQGIRTIQRGREACVAVGKLRLGLYDPDPESNRILWTNIRLPDDDDGRAIARDAIAEFNRLAIRDGYRLCAGVFPVRSKSLRRHQSS